MPKVVRNTLTAAIEIIKLPNASVHDSGNWTCNNFNNKMERKKTGAKIKDSNAIVSIKKKTQMPL